MTGMTKLIAVRSIIMWRSIIATRRINKWRSIILKYGQISHKFNKNYIPYSGCMQKIFSNLANNASQ